MVFNRNHVGKTGPRDQGGAAVLCRSQGPGDHYPAVSLPGRRRLPSLSGQNVSTPPRSPGRWMPRALLAPQALPPAPRRAAFHSKASTGCALRCFRLPPEAARGPPASFSGSYHGDDGHREPGKPETCPHITDVGPLAVPLEVGHVVPQVVYVLDQRGMALNHLGYRVV